MPDQPNEPVFVLAANNAGIWEIRWSERAAAGLWRSRTLSTRTRDKALAQQRLDEFRIDEDARRQKRAAGTVAGIVKDYIERAQKKGATRAVEFALKAPVAILGGLTPMALTPDVIEHYADQRRDDGRKDATIRRELGALNAALNMAVKRGVLSVTAKPAIELPPEGPPRDLWMTEEQAERFWALAVGDSHGKPGLTRVTRFLCIAMETAARKGAILGLTWDRVDFAKGTIDFRDPDRRVTKKRRVEVPISTKLRSVLEVAHGYRDPDEPLVCGPGDIRTALDTFMARDALREFRDWVTPHVLRHTWATLRARAGVDLWVIAGVLGDDVKTVAKHYLKHCPQHMRAAVNVPLKVTTVTTVTTAQPPLATSAAPVATTQPQPGGGCGNTPATLDLGALTPAARSAVTALLKGLGQHVPGT